MSESQLAEIESAVGFPLPDDYRRLATASPFQPIGRDWVYWFFDEPGRVIEGTLAPLPDSGYVRNSDWHPGYLTIGQSATGDLFVMDTTAPSLPILCLCHETHAFEPEWPSLAAFVAEWLETTADIRRRSLAEAEANRRRMRLGWLILGASLLLPLAAMFIIWLVH